MKKLIVDMISESEFTVKGHGVHTSYVELTRALSKRQDIDIQVNVARPNVDITHIQTMGFYAIRKLLFSRGKKIVSAHIVPASFVGSIKGAKYWAPFSKYYLKWFYNRADIVLACSGSVARELVEDMKLSTRVETFYNTIDMSQYTHTDQDKKKARVKLGIDERAFLVLGNGQVQPRKRLDTMIACARALPKMEFIWVGGIPFKQLGADYHKMQKMVTTLPDNMHTTGVISLEQVRDYLCAADVFFLPAEQENHPMCVLEAAGAGLPIVLRDIPQYNDTFRPDALFIRDNNEAILNLKKLAEDPKFRAQAIKMSQRIAARFNSSVGAERAMALYQETLRKS